MERLYPKEVDVHTLSPLALAFVGDGVYSLLVRERLLTIANRPVNDLHHLAVNAVRAEAQSAAMERLLPRLTPEEEAVFKRGRNITAPPGWRACSGICICPDSWRGCGSCFRCVWRRC